jgi:cytochrome c5
MAEHHEMTKTTPADFLIATVGGLIPPGLAIFLIVMLVIGIQGRMGKADPAPVSEKEVQARIQPMGKFAAIDPNAPRIELTGEQVYTDVCSGCHASGALGSPKFKDRAAWAPRIAKGYDTLLTHALNGFNKMPAHGGEPDLSELEVARALVHMTNAAGAKFEPILKKEREPTAAELARGKVVYAENCAYCHDTGLTGAQKLNDTEAWSALLKKGRDELYTAALKGTFGGPAKGGNDKLSDADTIDAVDYMIDQAKAAIGPAKEMAKK